MIQNWYRYILFLLVIIILSCWPQFSYAASLGDLQQNQKQAADDAAKYQSLSDHQQQVADLYQAQVKQTEQNIASVQNALQSTHSKISQKENDISSANKDIEEQSVKLVQLKTDQDKALVSLYELQIGSANITINLVAQKTLSDVVDQSEFTQSVLDHVRQIAKEVTQTKKQIEDKKAALEQEKNDLMSLKGTQQAQQSGLVGEKQQKDYLLSQATELAQTYDQLAKDAEAKKEEFDHQIAAALKASQKGDGSYVRKGHVNQGDIIGHMGSTGFSTGPHVHFGVFKGGEAVNPRNYLGNILTWPCPSFYVSQEFGPANWKNTVYSFHNGTDVICSDGYGSPVHAAASGDIIEPFPNYNGWMPGGYGHYIVIDHSNGVWTLYGHLINN